MTPEDKAAFNNWWQSTGGGRIGEKLQAEHAVKWALEYARQQPTQPVQPAGEQGDAVHFRAVLCSEQQNRAVGVVPKVVGFVDRKAAEQFILEKRDFQGWQYNLESLYTTPQAQSSYKEQCQAEGWQAVTKTLDEVVPRWTEKAKTGMEAACNAIRELAQPVQPAGAQSIPGDSLLHCASDLLNSASYDSCSEMQSCVRAIASRIRAFAVEPPAAAINEQMLKALKATKAWLDAENNHEMEPDFYNRAAMANEAEHMVDDAIATAEAAKGGVREISDREWASKPSGLREGCDKHVPGVGDL